jgi:triosephosphate isomerase
MAEKDVDGALVGGASLSAEEFTAIVGYRKAASPDATAAG